MKLPKPENLILGFVIGFILISYLLIFLVDIMTDRPDAMASPLWVHFYREGGFAEMLQWAGLGTCSVVSAMMWGRSTRNGAPENPDDRFWLFFSIGTLIMLIEDAGNPRHMLARYFDAGLGFDHSGLIPELLVFGTIGVLLLYPLYYYGGVTKTTAKTRKLVISGYVFYAIAAASSFVGTIQFPTGPGEWYMIYWDVGMFLQDITNNDIIGDQSPHLIVDFMWEETVELLGVGFLCGFVLREAHKFRLLKLPY